MIRKHSGMVSFATIFRRKKIMLHLPISGVLEWVTHVYISIQECLGDCALLTGFAWRERIGKGEGLSFFTHLYF